MKIVYNVLWKLQVVKDTIIKDTIKTNVHFGNTFTVNLKKKDKTNYNHVTLELTERSVLKWYNTSKKSKRTRKI